MAEINGFRVSNSVLDRLTLPEQSNEQKKQERTELGQADFLDLLITQLENQNPLQPQEGAEFVAQLAQFSMVDGVEQMNRSFAELTSSFKSSQALQATSLVGRTVMVSGDSGRLGAEGVLLGSVEVTEEVDDMLINIYDGFGTLVRQDVVGAQPVGDFRFAWDGLNEEGERVPPGTYRIQASGLVGDETIGLPTAVSANVNSVTIGSAGELSLNVDGVGAVAVSEVKEIL
jgi:flagellar basal-body rod modification protein FlgD